MDSLRFIRPFLGLASCLALSASALQAQTYTETGDAGQSLPSAQATGTSSGNPLTTIFGTLSNGSDADLFLIMITSPTMFSATTNNSLTIASGLDTALFLLNSSGAAIYTNDDANGTTLQSTLPAGSSFTMSLSPGIYYLGISITGNEPVNLNNQLLFAGYPGGDSTAVRGPAAGISPQTLSSFNGANSFSQSGAYRIDLTATASAVPEPSAVVLSVAGILLLAVFLRLRRQSA